MPKKTSGRTRTTKRPRRYTAARAKISRRNLLVMGAGALAASTLPKLPASAAVSAPSAAETIAALRAMPFKQRLERAVRLYKQWRAYKTESDELERKLYGSKLLLSNHRALYDRANFLLLMLFDLNGKLHHAFMLALFAKEVTSEDERLKEDVLIPIYADYCRGSEKAMLREWREEDHDVQRGSHAG
ncbi:MAG: hypothetical protein F9K29_18240 [Hyphomicrobiaceae bacterium]|nr:MAG: hypothetical protein F9K29_18240 [Hyphomicrobiaceae bacterium]